MQSIRILLSQVLYALDGQQEGRRLSIPNALSIWTDLSQKIADRHVDGDDTEPNEGRSVSPLAPLRSITQRKEEAQDEKAKVEIVQYDVSDFDAFQPKVGLLQRCRQDDECNIVIGLQKNTTWEH